MILMRHELVTHADAFAAKAHEGQMRKLTRGCEEPYIEHPRRVARRVAGLTGSPRLVAAALLHDVIEDCGVRGEELRDLYGDDVAEWVWELTSRYTSEAFPDMNRKERKQREADRLGRCSAGARLIKWCDTEDNLRCVSALGEDFAAIYREEKRLIIQKILPLPWLTNPVLEFDHA